MLMRDDLERREDLTLAAYAMHSSHSRWTRVSGTGASLPNRLSAGSGSHHPYDCIPAS